MMPTSAVRRGPTRADKLIVYIGLVALSLGVGIAIGAHSNQPSQSVPTGVPTGVPSTSHIHQLAPEACGTGAGVCVLDHVPCRTDCWWTEAPADGWHLTEHTQITGWASVAAFKADYPKETP